MENKLNKEIINEALKQEILQMVEEDQKLIMNKKQEPLNMTSRKHTGRLKEIIKEFGWPGRTLVGGEAAKGAWLLAQHADHDPEFQKQALALLQEAVRKGEAEKRNEAYLTDRVRVNSGQPQIFGTQFYRNAQGIFGPRPIEDAKNLEEKRKAVGLGPFSEYEQWMREEDKGFEERKQK